MTVFNIGGNKVRLITVVHNYLANTRIAVVKSGSEMKVKFFDTILKYKVYQHINGCRPADTPPADTDDPGGKINPQKVMDKDIDKYAVKTISIPRRDVFQPLL